MHPVRGILSVIVCVCMKLYDSVPYLQTMASSVCVAVLLLALSALVSVTAAQNGEFTQRYNSTPI